MNKTKLIVPSGVRYISRWNEYSLENFQFPHILDKKIPGCGYTEYCLGCSLPIILCSPRKILLENKEAQPQHLGKVFYFRNELEYDSNIDKDISESANAKLKRSSVFDDSAPILDNSIIKFFNESFYINDSDISENFLKQIENVQLMNPTAIYADLTYNGQNDLFIFRGDSIAFYTLIISLNDFLNTTEIFHSLEIDNGCVKSIDIGKIFCKNIAFCIINNKRGFKVPYLYKNNQMLEQFYYWSPKEQKYMLDKSVTQEQIQNAYCPEDYFAYNGLKFSKLDSKLTDEDLKGLDKAQLRLMRNAVYARHGRTFKSEDLQSLWECYNWYEKNPNYSDDLLTEVDKYNIELIQKYEK